MRSSRLLMQRIVFACDEVAELLDKTGTDKARKENCWHRLKHDLR